MAIRDYLVPVFPVGAFSHLLRADTLAGHLCWAFAQTEGEAGASRFIEAARAGAFRLSDPFPEGCLPLPVDDPVACVSEWECSEKEFQAAMKQRGRDREVGSAWHSLCKRARKWAFVKRSAWRAGLSRPLLLRERIRGALAEDDLHPAARLPWEVVAHAPSSLTTEWNALHTAVNRVTHGAEAGTLHERVGVTYAAGSRLDLYLRCDEDELARYTNALAQIGLDGHLKHASSGWGRFNLGTAAPADMWRGASGQEATQERWVSLSPCVPEEGYAGEVHYRLLAHYGKLGGNSPGKVFKRAVVLLAAGATFSGPAPQGCWLHGVHEERPEVIHYAFAYPLAC